MYYVIEEFYVEASCTLLEIKTVVSEKDDVVLVSENYEDCQEFVDAYHEEINEQFKQAELNKG